MIRVLLVEDDVNSSQAVSDILNRVSVGIDLVVAMSRDSAMQVLTIQFFDLMILDLSIPADDASEVVKPEFGFAVFGRAKDISPGMPIFLLTGSSVESFVQPLLRNTQQVDIWGSGKVSTVCVQKKIDLDQFSKDVIPYIRGPLNLESVELQKNGINLSVE